MVKKTKPGKVSPAVRMAVNKLKSSHRLGGVMKRKLKLRKKVETYYRGEHRRIGKEFEMSEEMCRRHIRFFELYTPDNLKQLCDQCCRHNHPIGFSVVTKLFGVVPKKTRDKAQRLAIKQHWSAERLVQYLHDHTESEGKFVTGQKSRGRLPRAVLSLEELLGELHADSRKWNRIWELLQAEVGGKTTRGASEKKHLTLADLDADLANDLQELVDVFAGMARWETVEPA